MPHEHVRARQFFGERNVFVRPESGGLKAATTAIDPRTDAGPPRRHPNEPYGTGAHNPSVPDDGMQTQGVGDGHGMSQGELHEGAHAS